MQYNTQKHQTFSEIIKNTVLSPKLKNHCNWWNFKKLKKSRLCLWSYCLTFFSAAVFYLYLLDSYIFPLFNHTRSYIKTNKSNSFWNLKQYYPAWEATATVHGVLNELTLLNWTPHRWNVCSTRGTIGTLLFTCSKWVVEIIPKSGPKKVRDYLISSLKRVSN